MSACADMDGWLTRKVVVPVTRFIYDSEQKCEELRQEVKTQVFDRIEETISKAERFCRDLPWPLDMFCDVVVTVIKIVTWVPRIVVNIVLSTVCNIIFKVIGSFVELVTRTIAVALSAVLCAATDTGALPGKLLDAWRIVLDAVGTVFEVFGEALGVIGGVFDDLGELLDSIGDTLGPLGWILAPWKAVVAIGRGVTAGLRDAITGSGNLVTGLFGLDLCRFQRGATDIFGGLLGAGVSTGFAVFAPIKAVGSIFAGGRESIERQTMMEIITERVNRAFGPGSERTRRALESLHLRTAIAGRRFTLLPYRMYVGSNGVGPELDLRDLHRRGVIDLYALAGYPRHCPQGISQPQGELVYADSPAPVTYTDIRRYLRDGPEAVPEFWAVAVTIDRFRRRMDLAARKSTYLGVRYRPARYRYYRAHKPEHVPLVGGSAQVEIFKELGRKGHVDGDPFRSADDLSQIPLLALFLYANSEGGPDNGLHGLASPFEPSVAEHKARASGVSFRDESPEVFFRWVPTHELGHYLGIKHEGWGIPEVNGIPAVKRSPEEIMFSPDTGVYFSGTMLFEFLVAGGEPRFVVGDVRQVWTWITGDGKSLLP